VCVSESLRRAYVAGGYAPADKTCVLAAGSSNGVDAARFAPTAARRAQARALRRDLGVPPQAPVVGFVGRLVPDKGVAELLDAFDALRGARPDARLLLLGGDLGGDALPAALARRARRTPGVVAVGPTAEPAPYYALMDALAFPSHREGFPNVPLEAAAAEVPVVGFRATGVVDAVEDGRTGRLVPRGDAAALAAALQGYLADADLRRAHGAAGRARVCRLFAREVVWRAWAAEYARLLRAHGLPAPPDAPDPAAA
jgi:glycosyltransferase involved in cell wall biosynthesis